MSTQSTIEEKKNDNDNGNGNQKPVNIRVPAGLYHSLKAMAHRMFQDKNLDRLLRHLYEQEKREQEKKRTHEEGEASTTKT